MRRSTTPLVMLAPALVAFAVTACGGGGSSGTAPPTVSTSTRPLSRVDPCVVVTAAEASSLAGGSFGAGTRSAVRGSRRCVYGANSLLVFTVEVSRARSAADAEAAFAQDEARARSAVTRHLPAHLVASLHLSDVSGLGDRAAIGTYSANIGGEVIGVSAIYVLHGATFLTFSDVNLGGAAPTDEAMEDLARTSLSRL